MQPADFRVWLCLQHLLQIGAILAADLQPVVVLARLPLSQRGNMPKASLLSQGMSPVATEPVATARDHSQFD